MNENLLVPNGGEGKTGPTKFARVLFENNITLKEIEENADVSYPVLIDLKNGNRDNYHDRTLKDIVTYINKKYKLKLKSEDIEGY